MLKVNIIENMNDSIGCYNHFFLHFFGTLVITSELKNMKKAFL